MDCVVVTGLLAVDATGNISVQEWELVLDGPWGTQRVVERNLLKAVADWVDALIALPPALTPEVNRIATEAATAAVEDLRTAVTDFSLFVCGYLAGAA
eukprot:gene8421-10005_t